VDGGRGNFCSTRSTNWPTVAAPAGSRRVISEHVIIIGSDIDDTDYGMSGQVMAQKANPQPTVLWFKKPQSVACQNYMFEKAIQVAGRTFYGPKSRFSSWSSQFASTFMGIEGKGLSVFSILRRLFKASSRPRNQI
jgi:hypothetical protein